MITRKRLIEEFVLLDEKARLMNAPKMRLYLIGGGNLALRGIKPATADVDLIVESIGVLKRLDDVLTNPSPELRTSKGLVVYVKVVEHEYQKKLGAYSVYRKLDPELGDFNLDVFVRRVLRGITLTEGIKGRAVIPDEFDGLERLRVYLVSPEDIFLFKGVTSLGRSKDVDDILRLLEVGVEFGVVFDEVMTQREVLEPERFDWLVGLLLEKMLVVQGILRKRGLKSSGLDRFIDSLKGLINEWE